MIASDTLRLRGVRHAFFTREGGVSEGIYASLNCGLGSGDDPARVAENRRRAMGRLGLGPGSLSTLYQVHSAEVVTVDAPFGPGAAPRADAQVTARPGVALGILTADCAPVLFADAEAGVVGAAHAGWRGALAGIVDATVAAMEALGAARGRIAAAIGPAIGQDSYEVGPEFRAAFLAADPASDRFFAPGRPGRHLFDLPCYVESRLAAAGLGAVARIAADTCAAPDRFFSYRRVTLEGGGDYGRALAAIALEG